MLPGGCQQPLFANPLFPIQSFRNTIGVKPDGVASSQFAFLQHTLPFLEQTHDCAGCLKLFQTLVATQEEPATALLIPDPQRHEL